VYLIVLGVFVGLIVWFVSLFFFLWLFVWVVWEFWVIVDDCFRGGSGSDGVFLCVVLCGYLVWVISFIVFLIFSGGFFVCWFCDRWFFFFVGFLLFFLWLFLVLGI